MKMTRGQKIILRLITPDSSEADGHIIIMLFCFRITVLVTYII